MRSPEQFVSRVQVGDEEFGLSWVHNQLPGHRVRHSERQERAVRETCRLPPTNELS